MPEAIKSKMDKFERDYFKGKYSEDESLLHKTMPITLADCNRKQEGRESTKEDEQQRR